MDRLYKLMHSLTPQQVKVLRSYLTSFSTRDGNTKFWELAEFVLKSKNGAPSIEECSGKIYKALPDSRIDKLKNRVYDKVLDSLLIDINTSRNDYEDELQPIQIKLRKKMILWDLLKQTPLRETAGLEMVKDIITTARQYELYPILLDALYILKRNYGLRKGMDFFEKMNREIEVAEKGKQHAQRALDLYVQLGQVSTFDTKADIVRLKDFLWKCIEELRQYSVDTGVKSVLYFLKVFEMSFQQLEKQYEEAKATAFSILTLLKEHKVLNRRGRFGVTYTHIAEFEIFLGNYDSALEYLRMAREYIAGSQINLAINKKLEVDVLFLKGDYTKAKELIEELSLQSANVTGDFRRDIYLYYKGCCQFMLGEIRDAARLLNQNFVITKDKLGWDVNIRFMRILVMVERDKPDEAALMVMSLAKHIQRYQQSKALNERDKMLMSLFRALQTEGFAFHRPGENAYRLLLLLKEHGKPHSWEPLSPELIQIHNWIIRKYKHFLPPHSDEKRAMRGSKEEE
ncbi:MAG TPA: hypothetical protein VI731_02245 [Bacteroidia bacterium]|nr:hypothetical protein [Bacteroidia bacterium]